LECLNTIDKNLCHFEEHYCNRYQTWINQSNYAFVLSPEGGGMDCHRTWEALALGCIPIVKRSSFSDLFQNLPVLIVDDWSEINQQLLIEAFAVYKDAHLNMQEITMRYWADRISILT
jgi:hypothetical protein